MAVHKDFNKLLQERIAYQDNEKKVNSLYKELAGYADRIEDIRVELFNNPIINGEEDRDALSDLLFKLQSQLRYDTKEFLECMVILDD